MTKFNIAGLLTILLLAVSASGLNTANVTSRGVRSPELAREELDISMDGINNATLSVLTKLFPEIKATSEMTGYAANLLKYAATLPMQILSQHRDYMYNNVFNKGKCYDKRHEPQPSLAASEDDAYMMGRYAAVAYCLVPKVVESWGCGRHCNDPSTRGTSDVTVDEDIVTGIRYFVAWNREKRSIIVSFRGTLAPASFLVDAAVAMMPYKMHPSAPGDAMVHAGFHYAYYRIMERIRQRVSALVASKKYATLDVTGHSLGGAIAALCALDLHGQGMVDSSALRLFTYGQPRTGNPAFAQFVSTVGLKAVTRMTFNNDVIPHLPPMILGYSHHRGEVWLEGWWFEKEEKGGIFGWLRGVIRDALGWERRVTVCKDKYCEDSGCADRAVPWLNILNHLRAWDITFGPWC